MPSLRRFVNPLGDDATQVATRWGLGLFMAGAGMLHLTVARGEFEKIVPQWIPGSAAAVVVASGVVELTFGAACWLLPRQRRTVCLALAVFFVLVFFGNIHQYAQHINAFGLDSDTLRLERLFFQPVLVLAAVWAAGIPRVRRPRSRG